MIVDPNLVIDNDEDIPVYDKGQILTILRDNLPSVIDMSSNEELKRDKYARLAIEEGYTNYRVCTVADILRLKLFKSLSYYTKNFINDNGMFLIIFNELAGKPISAVLRSIKVKEFSDLSQYRCLYGLDMLKDDFRYGDTILLSEGIYDADSFRPVFHNSLAVLTSSVSPFQAEILCTMTDKFIVAMDSDTAGLGGFNKTEKRLKKVNSGIIVKRLNVYPKDKDLGVMREVYNRGETDEYNMRYQYYLQSVRVLLE